MEIAAHGFPHEALLALTSATAAINSTLDSSTVFERIAQWAASVMRAEASSVLAFDEKRNKLVFLAAVGASGPSLAGREFDADKGIAGRALQTGEVQNIPDVAASSDFFEGIDSLSAFKTRGLLAAPMVCRSGTVGVVEVLNRKDGGSFSATDVELLKTFANLSAVAARNALTHENLKKQNRALRESAMSDAQIIGSSGAVKEMLDLADRVAPTNATVLLLGETGTGKEVLARYIHNSSRRAENALIAVNCAALPETLLESELFGHERGAFTGAIAQRIGRFELADGGTLFLDEIGDISPSIQIKLLRLLQERAITRVGGTKTIGCDVRVMAATNRDLRRAIKEERFRDDLFYRLNVFPITLPPLRERRGDVSELTKHFTKLASVQLGVEPRSVSDEAAALLDAHDWPGNIRELSNVLERAVLMCDEREIQPIHLPAEIQSGKVDTRPAPGGGLRENERAMITRALIEHHWNQTRAARALGISRDNLRYRVKKYNIDRDKA